MPTTHLWPGEPEPTALGKRFSFRLESAYREPVTIWYDVPEELLGHVTSNCNAYLVGSLFHLMQDGGSVHVHGAVTKSLIPGVKRFVDIASAWWPASCTTIQISADEWLEDRTPDEKKALMLYSGGLDATSIFHWHRLGRSHYEPLPIQTAIMVRGFNIGKDEYDRYATAFSVAEKSLQAFDTRLHTITSNWMEASVNWPSCHVCGLVSFLMLFEGGFSRGVFGNTLSYADMIPWGSHPMLDAVLSHGSFQLLSDDCVLDRTGKVRFLSQLEGVFDHLLVCHYFDEKGKNCGRCEKCLRTALSFIANELPLPESLNIESIEWLQSRDSLKELRARSASNEGVLQRFFEAEHTDKRYPAFCRFYRRKRTRELLRELACLWKLEWAIRLQSFLRNILKRGKTRR